MTDNKNLIKLIKIDGNEVAVERQGINNCMVSLTDMAKPYGKKPNDWLKIKSTQEYLEVAKEMMVQTTSNIFDVPQPIIIRNGGAEINGTWCTDYHVALRFAQWLDPVFAWKLDDAIIKLLTGRNVGTLANARLMPLPKFRDGFQKLEAVLRRYTSLNDLKTVAKEHSVTLHHVKDVLKGNKTSNPVLQSIIDIAKVNHDKGIVFPDWRIRKKSVDFNQALIDFEPQAVVELDTQED